MHGDPDWVERHKATAAPATVICDAVTESPKPASCTTCIDKAEGFVASSISARDYRQQDSSLIRYH